MSNELLTFRNASIVPPGGYQYIDSDTNHHTQGGTFDHLVELATTHRKANGLDVPPNFRALIEDWICRRIPADMTSEYNRNRHQPHRKVSTYAVQTATTQLLHAWRSAGRLRCTAGEANERAAICADCKKNVQHVACLSCHGLKNWIKDWMHRGTPHDDDLYVCDVCAILCLALVHVRGSILKDFSRQENLAKHPEHCWKRAYLENNNA